MMMAPSLSANNLSITNMSVVGTDRVQFDVSWDNSWWVTNYNWDAIWVFLKAQDCAGTSTWDPVELSTSVADHSVSGGTGLIVETVSDGMGVFIRRNSPASGTQTGTITLQFATAMPGAAAINFRVFGTEMVWVPQGNFSVGDGSSISSHSFASFGAGTNPRLITNEGAMGLDFLRNDAAGPNAITAHNGLPAAFPKGWAGFYCMKYEISQQQYVAFLNTLSQSQQFARTANPPTAAAGTLAMTSPSNQNRNAIVVTTPAVGTSAAAYATDLNGDGTLGDGDDLACNFLSWSDLISYLDWSGLRPMTELEYEKAVRGSGNPVLSEYAWGSTFILQAISDALSNAGTASETSSASGMGLCAFNAGASTTLGPLRTGFAAGTSPIRGWAGASAWGIMEMSGNVWEQTVSCGYWNGSARLPGSFIFNGAHGDGRLEMFSGDANAPTWPTLGLTPGGTVIVRGGNWQYGGQRSQVSDRFYVNSVAENLTRTPRTGGRGVRKP